MPTTTSTNTESTIDGYQTVVAGTTIQLKTVSYPNNQTAIGKTCSTIPPRRTFKEQKPFVFSVIGFAIFYIAALIIGRIIKMRIKHRSIK